MRISDWSSDVCSSDLAHSPCRDCGTDGRSQFWCRALRRSKPSYRAEGWRDNRVRENYRGDREFQSPGTEQCGVRRSEEHTSELQSLMRISYAVFCLKKKNYKEQQYVSQN